MASKFSDAVLAEIVAASPMDFDKATAIAEAHDLKPRSVVAAAIRAGVVYKRKARLSKTGKPVQTKEDLVKVIAANVGLETSALEGLEKAPKTVLEKLAEALGDEDEAEVEE